MLTKPNRLTDAGNYILSLYSKGHSGWVSQIAAKPHHSQSSGSNFPVLQCCVSTPGSLGYYVAGFGGLSAQPSVCGFQPLSAESQLATLESELLQPAIMHNSGTTRVYKLVRNLTMLFDLPVVHSGINT